MPLLVAIAVYGGSFCSYITGDAAINNFQTGKQAQLHYLDLKRKATAIVAAKVLKPAPCKGACKK